MHPAETDVQHLGVFRSHTLVLSKAEPVLELFKKRSALHSDRVRNAPCYDFLCTSLRPGKYVDRAVRFPFSVYRKVDENSSVWVLTEPLCSCRTGAGGERTVASSTDSLMPSLLSDSTLDRSRVYVAF